MKPLYILFIAAAICTISCRAKQGDPGPAGTTGATGATGADGAGTLDKQGSVTGTLAYVDYKDSALSIPFTYEYITSLEDSEYEIFTNDGMYYEINLTRRDPKDQDKFLSFSFNGNFDESGNMEDPQDGSIDFSYVTTINKNLFGFTGNGSPVYFGDSPTICNVTNFKLDTLSGRLTFGYVVNYDPSDIDSDVRYDDNTHATVTGSVDVILNRKRAPKVTYAP